MEKLKLCPFCGGDPVLLKAGRLRMKLQCNTCFVSFVVATKMHDLKWVKSTIKAAWNKRVKPKATKEKLNNEDNTL